MSAQLGRVDVANVTGEDVVDVTFHGAMVPGLERWLQSVGFRLVPLDVIGAQDEDGIPGFIAMPTADSAARIRTATPPHGDGDPTEGRER